jgi:hypothetical protein
MDKESGSLAGKEATDASLRGFAPVFLIAGGLAMAGAPAAFATMAAPMPGAPGATTLHKPLPKRHPLASISLKCGKTVYVLSVPAGSCNAHAPTGGSANSGSASCGTDDGSSAARANCKDGCLGSEGDGSCTIK